MANTFAYHGAPRRRPPETESRGISIMIRGNRTDSFITALPSQAGTLKPSSYPNSPCKNPVLGDLPKNCVEALCFLIELGRFTQIARLYHALLTVPIAPRPTRPMSNAFIYEGGRRSGIWTKSLLPWPVGPIR